MSALFINNTDVTSRYGVIVSGGGAFNSASRDVTEVDILGPRGKLYVDNGRWLPCKLEYECGIVGQDNMDAFRAFLASLWGLEVEVRDAYHPKEYYLAHIIDGLDVTPTANNGMFKFKLSMTRRPERYIGNVSGSWTVASGVALEVENTCAFPVRPTFTLGTAVTVTIDNGMHSCTVTAPGGETIVNGEEYIATVDGDQVPMSDIVDGELYLYPGTNYITPSVTASIGVTAKLYTL